MFKYITEILLSDNGEKSISITSAILTFFGLDSFVILNINNVFMHEFLTGIIKMIFSVITAIIVYFVLEFIKTYRNGQEQKKGD